MTLYEIDKKAFDPYWNESHYEALAAMIEAGYIRERKRCEHGNYDPHRTPNVNPTIGWGDYRDCPGAGIGGDDG